MPFRTFNQWLFDGDKHSQVPKTKDILKYNSPITHTFVLQMFLRNGPLNDYLDKYFNNYNLYYLDKEEFLRFIKRCVIDFRIKRNDIVFYPRQAKNKLYEKLREKLPYLKNNDVELLTEMIEKSDKKGAVYQALGLEVPKKKKIKIGAKKSTGKMSLKRLLNEHFSVIKK